MSVNKRFLLDAVMLAAIVAAYFPSSTGVSLHEYLSLSLIVALLVHLVVNWDWVTTMVPRIIDKLKATTRLNLVVDILLFVSTVTVMLSGLCISVYLLPALGLTAEGGTVWAVVHSVSADWTIGLTLAHSALHWRWAVRVAKNFFAQPVPTTEPARVAAMRTRGDN